MTSTGHDIGAAADFVPGRPYRVMIRSRPILVVRKGGEFYAIRDGCPHAGASLAGGTISGMPAPCRPGEPGDYIREGELVVCPWHGWSFDLKTGCSLVRPERYRVRAFPVRVDAGRVIVEAD